MPAFVLRFAALPFVAALFATSGASADVYKNVMPDGRIIYSDAPVKGARKSQAVEVPPPPSEADQQKAMQRARENQRKKNELETRNEDRRQQFDDAEARVKNARTALAAAQLALDQGRTPLPGEFVGMAGGGARPSESYLQRVAALEQAVESAKKELDDALRAVNQAK
ncbi:MAG: DUF4124 domain-containing protein [Betaproteobacteria bacterium]